MHGSIHISVIETQSDIPYHIMIWVSIRVNNWGGMICRPSIFSRTGLSTPNGRGRNFSHAKSGGWFSRGGKGKRGKAGEKDAEESGGSPMFTGS